MERKRRESRISEGCTGRVGVPRILYGSRLLWHLLLKQLNDLIMDVYLAGGLTLSRRNEETVGRKNDLSVGFMSPGQGKAVTTGKDGWLGRRAQARHSE